MPKVSEYYPDNAAYFRAEDLTSALPVKVATVEVDDSFPEQGPDIVLGFESVDRKLRLNKTNAQTLSAKFGDEADAWIGKEFTLVRVSATFQGKTVPAIRVSI